MWQRAGNPSQVYLSARAVGSPWGPTERLPMREANARGTFRYTDRTVEHETARVELRVWQSVSNPLRVYLSARALGGSWGRTEQVPMSQTNTRGTFRYGDLNVRVAVRGPVLQVTAGGEHSCALLATGEVICWGDGSYGQRDVPPSRYRSVTAGEWHACALRDSGEIVCWGGDYGWKIAESVDAPSGAYRSVSAGHTHTCAVNEAGAAVCWGDNFYGQASPPPGSYRSVSGGTSHSCGVLESGEVQCWGGNRWGQTNAPEGRFRSVHAGYDHTCGITEEGEILCWGASDWPKSLDSPGSYRSADSGNGAFCAVNDSGELLCWGRYAAARPSGAFRSVSVEGRHACAVRTDGTVVCWGDPFGASLATAPAGAYQSVSAGGQHNCSVHESGVLDCWGPFASQEQPAGTFRAVSAGVNGNACATRESGELVCWGDRYPPVWEPPPGTYQSLSLGFGHGCAVRDSGELACWGGNDYGRAQPPAGTYRLVTAGFFHTCALSESGELACWGNNHSGQTDAPSGQFRHLDARDDYTCAVRDSGELACWGNRQHHRTDLPAGTYQSVSVGWQHACALDLAGTVVCWGENAWGQAEPPSGRFLSVSAARYQTCALKESGEIACWGGKLHSRARPPARVQLAPLASADAPGDAALAACANGIAVPDPDDHAGLVQDCAVLLEARDTLQGEGEAVDWSAATPIEDWSGVRLWGLPPRVISVRVLDGDVRGQIPPGLARLTHLVGLTLSGNQLTGEIPPELGQLSDLRWLRLGRNRLTGTIPPELGRLAQLQELDLADNELTGEIPPELGRLSQLETLALTYWAGRNEFTGIFPTALGDLSKLTEIRLNTRNMTGCVPLSLREFAGSWTLPFCPVPSSISTLPPPDPQLVMACSRNGAVPDADENPGLVDDCAVLLEAKSTLTADDARLNWSADRPVESWEGISVEGSPRRVAEIGLPGKDLGGRIPAGLARLSHLRELWLSGNTLSGAIPRELGQLWNLRHLWLYDNALTGEIPPELAELRFLERLWLDDNQLSGPIPPDIGSLSTLESLELSGNRLTGTIPLALTQLTGLRRLELRGNQLTGGIPPQLLSMWSLGNLDLRDNRLTGAILPEFARFLGVLWLSGNQLTGCLPVTPALPIADYSDLGLPYCQCLGQFREGASPELTVGADGIPFMPHESTEVAGTYRVTFSLILDLPDGGRFSLGEQERNEAGEVLVSIAEEGSRSTLVIDPFTGEERSRSVVEGPPDCDVSIATLFDRIVSSARVRAVEPQAGPDGIQRMYRLQPVEGGKRYRIGGSRFTIDVPAGMRLTLEGYQHICVTPGGCHTLLELRDEGSGSRLSFDSATGEEFSRWVGEEEASGNVNALFDRNRSVHPRRSAAVMRSGHGCFGLRRPAGGEGVARRRRQAQLEC